MANESLVQQLSAFATRVGTECKTLHAEIAAVTATAGAIINDSAKAANSTYSSNKIETLVNDAKVAVKNDLLGGAGEAYDTLKELADLIGANQSAIAALETLAAGHVKFNAAQELSSEQKTQARDNIGAADASTVSTLSSNLSTLTTNIGDTSANFVTVFETALAATGV